MFKIVIVSANAGIDNIFQLPLYVPCDEFSVCVTQFLTTKLMVKVEVCPEVAVAVMVIG